MNCRIQNHPIKRMGRFVLVLGLLLLNPSAWGALTFPQQGAISPSSELDVVHYGPKVAVDDLGNAYALWMDNRNGNADIYFSYKPVGGSWSPNVRVNDDSGGYRQISPCIAVDTNRNAYALWEDYRNGSADIYFAYRPAGGVWGANVRVNDDGGTKNQFTPALAVDGNGTVYAIWEDHRLENADIYFSFLPVGSGWQTNVKVNDDAGITNQTNPSIAVDAARNAYAVWKDYRSGHNQMFFSYRPSGGTWQTNVRVDDDPAAADKYAPVIAADPDGNACAVWEDSRSNTSNDIFSSYRPKGGSWAANLKVNDDTSGYGHYNPNVSAINIIGDTYIFWSVWRDFRNGNADVYGSFLWGVWTANGKQPTTADTAQQARPTLGVGPGANACILWEDSRNNHWEIFGSCQPPFGVWEEDLRVNDDPAGTAVQYDPAIALDHQGNAFLVWEDVRNNPGDILFAYRPSGGPWGSPLKVNDDPGASPQANPAIALDNQGNAYAVWQDYRNGKSGIYFSYKSTGGNWGPNVRVNDDSGITGHYYPAIAVDGQGNAYAVWQDLRLGGNDIYFSYCPAGGGWGPNVRVNDDTVPASHLHPTIAVDGQGNAFAVWSDNRNGHTDIHFSYRPAGGVWGANIRVNEDLNAYRDYPVIVVDQGETPMQFGKKPFIRIRSFITPIARSGEIGVPMSGIKDGPEAGSQYSPSMAIDGFGRVVVVWVEKPDWQYNLYGAARSPGGGMGFICPNQSGQRSGDEIRPVRRRQ